MIPNYVSRGQKKLNPVQHNTDVCWIPLGMQHKQQGGVELKDVVVRASPDQPPHSLSLLTSLLGGVVSLACSTHTHSSLKRTGTATASQI
jgi:hypothetical protein